MITRADVWNTLFLWSNGLTERDIYKSDPESVDSNAEGSDMSKLVSKFLNKESKPQKHKILSLPENSEVIDATVIDGKAVPINEASDNTAKKAADLLFPKQISADEYKYVLDTIEPAFNMPWFVSRAIGSGILLGSGKITGNIITSEIEAGIVCHPESVKTMSVDNIRTNYQDIVNTIVSTFSKRGLFTTGVPRVPIEEVCEKNTLDSIANIVSGLINDVNVKAVVNNIKAYTYKYKLSETTPETPIDPVVMNNNTVKSEVNSFTVKAIDKAFGGLLTHRKHKYTQYSNDYIALYIDGLIDQNGQPAPFLIDPNVITGDGYNILGFTVGTGSCLINIERNRDIVKKMIENPPYLLTDEEYKKIKSRQFKNEELYAIFDMSGMSKYMSRMNTKQIRDLESKLTTIVQQPNVIMAGIRCVPRMRFSMFRSINSFTLVNDANVKPQADFLKQPIYPVLNQDGNPWGITITVNENIYTTMYNGSNIVLKF